jgi:hypothetical protein
MVDTDMADTDITDTELDHMLAVPSGDSPAVMDTTKSESFFAQKIYYCSCVQKNFEKDVNKKK